MIRRRAVIAAGLMLLSCIRPVGLPSEFHGAWDVTQEACSDVESHTGMTITAYRLQFHEATGEVSDARPVERQGIETVVSWSNVEAMDLDDPNGSPPPINLPTRLQLLDSGARLTFTMNGGTQVYVRCAGERP